MARRKNTQPPAHAFTHRAGVRITGTHITCDAVGSAEDLVFLSHAQAVGALGPRRLPLRRAGRQELLATEGTLALLGAAGQTLRKHALPAPFGRPFVLGGLRVELFASGHLPGAASLLCEVEGRQILYAGTIRREAPAFGAAACEVRNADALCVDGTFGDPRFVFPPRDEALAQVRRFVTDAIVAGKTPVLLAPVYGAAMDVADALATDGIGVRGHRAVVAAAAAFRAAGVKAPVVARFERKVGPGEALLWPPEAREAPLLGVLDAPVFAFVSGFSQDPDARARMRADAGIALSNQSGHADLLAYIEATGAREVAVVRGFAESFAALLSARGLDAYPLGPPQQMELFRG
jgi:putative mRNA 3-end processing factor